MPKSVPGPASELESDQLILGRYRLIAEAGSGGFASVQLAWDTRIQRRVAIKCIQLNAHDVINGVISGLEEARTAALLTGSNIVGVYDFELAGNQAYLIMEYVDGLSLAQLLREFGSKLSLNAIATIFNSVAQALEIAHENQVLHLDIKPDNILINRQGQVKVTDFGLASLSDAAGFGSAAGGTIGYMPPEQMRQENLDARCDEWALAAMTYEMLTHHNPFLAADLASAEELIEEAEIVLPSLTRDDLDSEADDVLFYALDPDRNERYDSIADFAEEMERFLGNPSKGKHELAVFVGDACEDFEESEEEILEKTPFFDRFSDRSKGVVDKIFSFANVGLLSFLALGYILPFNAASDPIFWLFWALFALAAVLKPHLGAVLSLSALGVSLLINGNALVAVLFLVATYFWWFYVGRWGVRQTNTALNPASLACVGLNPLTPLLIGLSLNIREVLLNVIMALFLSFVLAGYGSLSLFEWNPFLLTDTMPDVQANIWQLMQQASTWCMVTAWIVAAIIVRIFCLRETRAFAFCGVMLASAVLVCGLVVGAWLDSSQLSWLPEWPLLAASIGAGAIASFLCLFGVPARTSD